ncbi:LMBR1 domain-containing protein, putative [Plasmodium malariae]|uniref:LMBR1 domain-containing protein, putative n=1 Tax=Plasmodium malariae TaxID=5858 RepID=A0A1D3SQF5_PLAMA|nr:LMBR1 domain-containing protein, putative [Plasmodium malariae]SCO93675.1 LMBR1 domain-containing protein, putative [Plasmodium malariae]
MDIIACSTFAIIILLISVSCGTFYKYFVKSDESTLLTAVAFILSLSTSFILVLFIPIDIYLVSNGNLEISNLEINQKLISKFYHFMFWVLIFEAYVVVPFSYFYLKNKNSYKNEFDDNIMPCENAIESLKKTIYFIFFLVVLSIIGLIYRPGHKLAMEKGKEMEYISDLLDMNHTGQSAILFLMGCIVLVGVSFWATYTSYGIACLPLSFLQQKNIEYDRIELENRFTNLKEKEMMIKYKYNTYNEIRGNDKYEMEKIEKMKRVLSKYNYKLQEIEKSSESWVSYVTGIGLTFRVITGLIFLTFSFIIYISLLASITDKYFNSICAYKCGFVLEQINTIFNLLDTLLIFFSRFFPLDILVIASLAIYIFCCSLYGIVNVGIRIFFIPLYRLKPKKSSPETLLVLCFLIIHIILVLIMTLLTIAPNYITYGIQKIKIDDNIGYIKCSLKTDKNVCKMSVLSVFFNKIFFGIPYFANSYFFSNWMFILMYTFAFVYRIFFKKISYLDNIDEQDFNKEDLDENINLLPLETLT